MSSKRQLRRKQCEGKIKYPNLPEAERAARAMSKAVKQGLSAYKCKFCGMFHMGHTPAKVRQAMRRRQAAFGKNGGGA
jgi:hypothetical protein